MSSTANRLVTRALASESCCLHSENDHVDYSVKKLTGKPAISLENYKNLDENLNKINEDNYYVLFLFFLKVTSTIKFNHRRQIILKKIYTGEILMY